MEVNISLRDFSSPLGTHAGAFTRLVVSQVRKDAKDSKQRTG